MTGVTSTKVEAHAEQGKSVPELTADELAQITGGMGFGYYWFNYPTGGNPCSGDDRGYNLYCERVHGMQ